MTLPILVLLLAVPQAEPRRPVIPEPLTASEDAGPGQEADPHLLAIGALLRRADWLLDRTNRESVERAAEMYRYALQIDASSAEARAGSARAMTTWYVRRWREDDGLVNDAIDMARRAVHLAKDDPRAHAALAYALMAAESLDEAREAADQAWVLHTDTTPTWVASVYAQSLLARGDRDEALAVALEALSRRPDLAALHGLHAQVLLEQERYEEAVPPLRRAILLEPDYAPAIMRLAFAEERLGNRDAATALYARVADRFPEEKPRAYLLMAASLMARQSYEKALLGLQEVRFGGGRGLGEGTRLYLMAVCHENLGNVEKAGELYHQVIREYPLASFGAFTGRSAAVASYEALARIALSKDDLAAAARLLEEALELGHPTIDLFLTLSRVYLEHGLGDEAEKVLERAAATDFGAGSAGRKSEVYTAWARLIRASSDGPPPGERFARALDALHRHKESLLATANVAWYVEAARASLLMAAPEEALSWLRSAVAMGYDHLDWIADDPELAPLSRMPAFRELRPGSP